MRSLSSNTGENTVALTTVSFIVIAAAVTIADKVKSQHTKMGNTFFPTTMYDSSGQLYSSSMFLCKCTDNPDQREFDRLDLQHHLLSKTYGNRLHFAPLHNPRNCLDVGTGTGIWAVEFADEYPECQVVGTDLSPGQPTMCVRIFSCTSPEMFHTNLTRTGSRPILSFLSMMLKINGSTRKSSTTFMRA